MRYFLKIEFKGTNYHGWQLQCNANSIQKEIERCLSIIFNNNLAVVGCGRTDAGVHASVFYLHFDLEGQLVENFLFRLNCMLPEDIKVKSLLVPEGNDIHARFSAISRTYRYTITTEKDPFSLDFAYRFTQKLDINLMNEACKLILGRKDFSCFCKTGTSTATNYCDITYAVWEKNLHIVTFTITADRFLRNMVRAICGTMLEVGTNKITLGEFEGIIASKDRSKAGVSVPAKGLSLIDVQYLSVFSEFTH